MAKLPPDKIPPADDQQWRYEVRNPVERFAQLPPGVRKFLQEMRDSDAEVLHEMVEDFKRAKWFRGKLKWWGIWVLGLPAAFLAFYKPAEELFRVVKDWFKN